MGGHAAWGFCQGKNLLTFPSSIGEKLSLSPERRTQIVFQEQVLKRPRGRQTYKGG